MEKTLKNIKNKKHVTNRKYKKLLEKYKDLWFFHCEAIENNWYCFRNEVKEEGMNDWDKEMEKRSRKLCKISKKIIEELKNNLIY